MRQSKCQPHDMLFLVLIDNIPDLGHDLNRSIPNLFYLVVK